MEKEDGKYCDLCSEPQKPAVGNCPICKRDLCEVHKDSHGCPTVSQDEWDKHNDPDKPVPAPEPVEMSDDEQIDNENEMIDEYNDKVEKENIRIDEENRKKKKNVAIAIAIIGFAIVVGIAGASNGFQFDVHNVPTGFVEYAENNEMIKDADLAIQCESWNIEGKAIVDKYEGATEEYWNQADYDRAKQLEELILSQCVETKEDIMLKLDLCTERWLTLNQLIWYEMEANVIESLPEDREEIYNETYKEFFQDKCHVIHDSILEQQSVIDWKIANATDNKDKVID